MTLAEKEQALISYFQEKKQAAIAFSGGVDSVYLLYAAMKSGADVKAYYVKSAFQPEFELEDAKKIAAQLSANMEIIPVDVLAEETVVANPANRCYYCKQRIFGRILEAAARDGYSLICDGTNASDDAGDRPGMKALQELSVESPLRLVGLSKSEIRELSKQAGLFTWNKPAYACLATRIPTGVKITAEALARTEHAEEFLEKLGFTDYRVRLLGDAARLQLPEAQLALFIEKRELILEELKKSYAAVLLDLEVRG